MSNNGGVYTWSTTSASNATADSTVNWSAGMAPSSVSPSGRSMMASVAKYRDDISGAIVTGSGGTSTAYIVSSNQLFDSVTDMHLKTIAFTPNVTNAAGSPSVTLTVDGFAGPLRTAPNIELLAGTLIQGTPYIALYNNTDGAFYLQGFFGNPYNIPLGSGIDYWGATAPNSSFVFPIGQQISITTYASLFALFGPNRFGTDTSSLFFLPDRRGRVSAQLDPTGTITTSATMTPDGNTLGAKGGAQVHTLTTAEMPSHAHNVTDNGHSHGVSVPGGVSANSASTNMIVGVNPTGSNFTFNTGAATTGIAIQVNGGGGAHNTMQPTIACNYIIRII